MCRSQEMLSPFRQRGGAAIEDHLGVSGLLGFDPAHPISGIAEALDRVLALPAALRSSMSDGVVDLARRRWSWERYAQSLLLASRPGRLLTHTWLLNEIWGAGYTRETHYLRVYIRQLRRKLSDDPFDPRWIFNEPGIGYRWAAQSSK